MAGPCRLSVRSMLSNGAPKMMNGKSPFIDEGTLCYKAGRKIRTQNSPSDEDDSVLRIGISCQKGSLDKNARGLEREFVLRLCDGFYLLL